MNDFSLLVRDWEGKSLSFAQQLRTVVQPLIRQAFDLKKRLDSHLIFTKMMRSDRSWRKASGNYFDDSSNIGGAIQGDSSLETLGSVMTSFSDSVIIATKLKDLAFSKYTEMILNNRSNKNFYIQDEGLNKSITAQRIKAHSKDYTFKVKAFSKHLYEARQCLEMLKSSRDLSITKDMYALSDESSTEKEAIGYFLTMKEESGKAEKSAFNMVRISLVAMNRFESAFHILEDLPDSWQRRKLAEVFCDLSGKFESETRMIPQAHSQSQSIWSQIQITHKKAESLKEEIIPAISKKTSQLSPLEILKLQRLSSLIVEMKIFFSKKGEDGKPEKQMDAFIENKLSSIIGHTEVVYHKSLIEDRMLKPFFDDVAHLLNFSASYGFDIAQKNGKINSILSSKIKEMASLSIDLGVTEFSIRDALNLAINDHLDDNKRTESNQNML